MKNIRMKNGFNRLSDAVLMVKAGVILKNMSANEHFPSPTPTLELFTETINAFSAAVEKAQSKSKLHIAEKNSLRALLINRMHLLGNYVLLCSKGNPVLFTSSGFDISAPRQARPPLATPGGLVLSSGVNRGEIVLRLTRVANVQSYCYEITEHPVTAESEWMASYGTVSKTLFTGLTSGKEYCCRVAAYGIKEQVVYSDIVSRIAL